MSGEIKHEWNGSILTVISDSGTSSADLQGPKGDTGPRGPQGPAGIILDEQGDIVLDLASYSTSAETDEKIQEAVSGLATEEYVSAEIAKAQLEGADVDTSALVTQEDIANFVTQDDLASYATQDDLAEIEVDIDNATIIKDGNGNLRTAIGGYLVGYYATSAADGLSVEADKAVAADDVLCFEIMFEDGSVETFVVQCGSALSGSANLPYSTTIISKNAVYCEGIYVTVKKTGAQIFSTKGVSTSTEPVVTGMTMSLGNIPSGTYVPIDANFIPVDGTTIQVSGGKLTAVAGGSVDLSNYYTKAEIDSMDLGSGGGSDVDLSNYYTKAEVDAIALDGTVDLSDYYTKSEVDEKVPDMSNYYTKTETDNKILYGTSNLTAGVSSLATGTLYVVYE